MTLTTRLATFATQPLTGHHMAVDVLRLSMLDWLAVARAGVDEPVARITRDMVADDAGRAESSVLGLATRLPARAAALANGSASHALDYDDTHFAHIGHPSVAVIPAALAIAERVGATGVALQEAALVGVEASIRVGVWLGRAHYQTGFHQTATAGAFGAGLACARLLGMTADEAAMVLGLLATRASGLKSQFGTMGKPFNAGIAAANGVEAALLVARGFVANPDALEAAQGFGPTHAGAADMTALDGLGEDWRFETVSHKFHACCHGLHASLEALAMLGPLEADQIAGIAVRTHPRWMTVCNQPAPTTGLGAKFSYATVLPMAVLGHDTARLDSYTDTICADRAVQALRARVQVVGDDRISETATHLTVTLRDNSERVATFDLDAPMTLAVRSAKVRAKAASLLGAGLADQVWQQITDHAAPEVIGAALRA